MNGIKKVFVAIMALVVVLSTITGCSSRKNTQTAASSYSAEAPMAGAYKNDGSVAVRFTENVNKSEAAYYGNSAESEKSTVVAQDVQGIVGTGFTGTSSGSTGTGTSLDILAQRKVIRNANLSVEVDDFYVAYGNLQAMITGIGYISESNIHRDFYTYENERRSRVTGEITIRVDARHFDTILNDVKGLGEVIDDRIYSTDVTDQYFDTEGRLKVLKIEYEYLEEYMRSLTKPEDIFKTRTRMTELQTEIERLTGTLNKWNDLVELSTIYVRMTEKYPDEMTKSQRNTYWSRVENAFNRSITGIIDALGDLLIFIIQAIPVLLVLILAGWIVYRFAKKIIKSLNRKNTGERAQSAVRSDTENAPSTEDVSS